MSRSRRSFVSTLEELEPRRLLTVMANGVDPENMGKGMWGWNLTNTINHIAANVPEVTDMASFFQWEHDTQHVDYFITKAGSGSNAFTVGGQPNYTSAVVDAAHAAGLKIIPYFYIYGGSATHQAGVVTSVQWEIDVFNQTMDTIGGDGAILDIEGEYGGAIPTGGTTPDPTAAITEYFNGIGKSQNEDGSGAHDNLFVAYSSFPYVSLHPEVPFLTLGDYCDAAMPQCYWDVLVRSPRFSNSPYRNWADRTLTPEHMIKDIDSEYSAQSLPSPDANFPAPSVDTIFMGHPESIKPIILTAQSYNTATGDEIDRFIEAAKTDDTPAWPTGYHGMDFFDEGSTTFDQRDGISSGTIGVHLPTDFAASDGSSLDEVQLTWTPADDVTGYDIYRSTTDDFSTAQWLVSPAATDSSYDDTDSQFNTTYFYWMQSHDNQVHSVLSASESGYRRPPSPATVPGAADFNGDGKPDIFWHNPVDGTNFIWLMDGTTLMASVQIRTSAMGWITGGVGDFNGDHKADILFHNPSTGWNTVWFMDNMRRVAPQRLSQDTTDTDWVMSGAGDFNGDGKTDVLWRNYATGWNTVWEMNGTTRVQPTRIDAVDDPNWKIGTVGDFSSDRRPDIVFHNVATNQNVVWAMRDLVHTSDVTLPSNASGTWMMCAAADFDKDGRTDLIWRDANNARDAMWLMNSGVRKQAITLPSL